MINKLLLSLFFSSLTLTIWSQELKQTRIEIEINSWTENHRIIPAAKFGVCVFNETELKRAPKSNTWNFELYDTLLYKAWSTEINVSKRLAFDEYVVNQNWIHLIFTNEKSGIASIVTIDLIEKSVSEFDIKINKYFYLSKPYAKLNNMYLEGRLKNKQVIYYVNLTQKTGQLIPFDLPGITDIESIEFNSKNEVNIVVSNYYRKFGQLHIRTLKGANQLSEVIIKPKEEYNLLDGKIMTLNNNKQVVLGTYAIGKGNSSGMYFSTLKNGYQDITKYYNFTDFNNFFSYLSEKKQEKIERKKERAKARDKELDFSYQLLVHDLIFKNNEYIMVAEAYYATYRTETYYTSVPNGNGGFSTVMQTRTVFDGWLYSHAVIAGFDENGNKLWDNSFEMGDFKTFQLKERVKVNNQGDKIELIYAGSGNTIYTKVIKGSSIIDEKQSSKIENLLEEDELKVGLTTSMENWYDNFFIASGLSKIKNKELENNKKRKVFYINKIEY